MKRLLVVMVSIIVLLLALNCTALGAVQAVKADIVNTQISNANSQIQGLIDKAVIEGDNLINKYNQEVVEKPDNATKLTNDLNNQIDKLINNLLKETNKISSNTINDLSKQGVEVICDWVPVTIAGRDILVDPMRVVGI